MKSVNLLLAGSDRQLNNLIEAAIRDACYGQAFIECTRCSRLDEFVLQGRSGWLDLIVVAPGSLLPGANRRGLQVSVERTTEAVRCITSRCSIPILAVNVPAEDQLAFLEAGVDNAFGFPLESDALKGEVRRVLRLPELVAANDSESGWSLFHLLVRGWQRLKSA